MDIEPLEKAKILKKVFSQERYKKHISDKKSILAPNIFSFIQNTEETIKFFEQLNSYTNMGFGLLEIDMRNIKELSVDVLIYIISFDKAIKKRKNHVTLSIQVPKDNKLKYKIRTSGIENYFKSDGGYFEIPKESFFPIKDSDNREEFDEKICANAVDFSKQFFSDREDEKLFQLYETLVELMQNTTDHAYEQNSKPSNSWFLQGFKNEKGVVFNFFDNGKGILNTVQRKLTEKILYFKENRDSDILHSALKGGEFRSSTGLLYRNKGLPQIKSFLDQYAQTYMLLTNKVKIYKNNNEEKTETLKYNFRGTFFIWLLKGDNNE